MDTRPAIAALAIVVIGYAALIGGVLTGHVASPLPVCEWETGEGQSACVWHADRQGDGRGDSLLLVAGHTVARW